MGTMASPSPRPSPAGRGRIFVSLSKNPGSHGLRRTPPGCALSPREGFVWLHNSPIGMISSGPKVFNAKSKARAQSPPASFCDQVVPSFYTLAPSQPCHSLKHEAGGLECA